MRNEATRPCKGCTAETGRFPGCHATCPKYKAAEEANRERREAERRDRIVRHYISGEVEKAKKSSRRLKKRAGGFQ